MKTTLEEGLAAIASGLQDLHPGTSTAQVRAVWDKLQAGTALEGAFELAAGEQIQSNRKVLEHLRTVEERPHRALLEQQALQALTWNDAFLALGAAATNADRALQLERVTRECSGVIRLLLRRFEGSA